MTGKFSFDDSLKKIQIPVITLTNNNRRLNFILDTGSSTSAINESCLNDLDYQMLSDKQTSIGVEGNPQVCEMCGMHFTGDNGQKFIDVMTIVNMDDAFKVIRDTEGIDIHGILGSTFFTAYKCVLDFNKKMIFIQ